MSDSESLGPGTILADRYELTKLIGKGGFGEVYEAKQLNMDRAVAVKILPVEFMSVYDVVARFKREAKLASRLRHPNTITLHDYGQHGEILFIVMELLEGEDLADLLKVQGRLPLERIFHIANGILKSLAEAHEHGIVHRDLKPENIFLSTVGEDQDHIKVLDFGIAKLALPEVEEPSPERKLTLAGSTVGTPAYMSPEQAAGEEVDGQSDLYALGVMMYEMANGRPPFHDKDLVKIMRAHLFEPVPRLRDPVLHGTLFEKVVMKALEKERGKRFQSASEFLLAIAGGPVVKPLIQGLPNPMHFLRDDAHMGAAAFVIPPDDSQDDLRTKPADTSSIIQIIHPTDGELEDISRSTPIESESVILLTKRKNLPEEKPAQPPKAEPAQAKMTEWSFDEEREERRTAKRIPIWLIFTIFLFALAATAWFTRELWQ